MTWHQWHQTAPIERPIRRSSARARANASSPHSCHSTRLDERVWWIVIFRGARFLRDDHLRPQGYHGWLPNPPTPFLRRERDPAPLPKWEGAGGGYPG